MHTVGVSSVTGEGVGDLLVAIEEAKKEYFSLFLPSIRVRIFELCLGVGEARAEKEGRSGTWREGDGCCKEGFGAGRHTTSHTAGRDGRRSRGKRGV